jgi:hypothetical protein
LHLDDAVCHVDLSASGIAFQYLEYMYLGIFLYIHCTFIAKVVMMTYWTVTNLMLHHSILLPGGPIHGKVYNTGEQVKLLMLQEMAVIPGALEFL